MDKIKVDFQNLLIYVAIGVVSAGTTAWFLYQNRMDFFKAQACSAFRVALMEELQNLSKISDWRIENENYGYQLKSPHFIEKISK